MKFRELALLLLTSIFVCSNAWSVAIYCSDTQYAGTGTMINDFYMDASDWSYGTLDPAVTFDGPAPYSYEVFDTFLDLSSFPGFLRYPMSSPSVGTNWVYGNGTTGWLIPGPGGGYVVGSAPTPCSHPKYFPEPDVSSFVFTPTSLYDGQIFNATWSSTGDAVYCEVDGDGPYAPSGSQNFTATTSLSGMHSMICYNDWGQSTALSKNLTVNGCPDPGQITYMNVNVSNGSSPGSGNIGELKRSGTLSLDSSAYCSGEYWKIRVTQANHSLTLHANIGALGLTQISTSSINAASCTVLGNMKHELEYYSGFAIIPSFIGGHYDNAAVYAHEDVHRAEFVASMNAEYTDTRIYFETNPAFRVAIDSASSPSDARATITGKSEYTAEIALIAAVENGIWSGLDHTPSTPFISATQSAVSGYISQINTRLATSCP